MEVNSFAKISPASFLFLKYMIHLERLYKTHPFKYYQNNTIYDHTYYCKDNCFKVYFLLSNQLFPGFKHQKYPEYIGKPVINNYRMNEKFWQEI